MLFRGATLVDGSGQPTRPADVAVVGERIVEIAAAGSLPRGRRTIDATGLALAPGFIDMHSHADFTLPAYPGALNSLSQGVTSEVVGNCGWSPAPLSDDRGKRAAMQGIAAGIGPDLDWEWGTTASFFDRLDAARPAVNCIPLVGHSALRVAVMGMDDREPTDGESHALVELLGRCLAEGAWGMSSGLVYPPSSFAAPAELVALASRVAEDGALYASHTRDEADHAVAAVVEAIRTAELSGVRLQVSHLKSAGVANRGRVQESLRVIAAARDRGLDVHCDVYPYEAMSTFLSQALPPWVLEGGVQQMVERLRSAEVRARIAGEVVQGLPGWANLVAAVGGWERVFITHTVARSTASAAGRWLIQVAAEQGRSPLDAAIDLLVADHGGTVMILFGLHEDDVRSVLAAPFAAVGSDQLGVVGPDARVHPRAWGTFARVVGAMVRDGLLPLSEAVHRMTGMPARILGLADRGRVVPGAVADLVLFDPATVSDRATYERPSLPAAGIEMVTLAGRPAVDGGVVVDARAGHVLRRSSTDQRAGPTRITDVS